MQRYTTITQEHPHASPETTVFLTPAQIKVTTPTKNSEQNRNAIIRLASSIKKYGILEPLEVKEAGNYPGIAEYELISGERRLKAATLAGVTQIPCYILPESDRKCRISAILTQLCRESLHFFEQAAAFRMLITDFSLTQEEIARRTGFSQSAIANKMRLLALSKEEQLQITHAELTERHARAILRLKSNADRATVLARIKAQHLNVADAERLVEGLLAEIAQPSTRQANAAFTTVFCPHTPPQGAIPSKFALKDLTPLYNSIERTLSIFRKTGADATCTREESRELVRIIIDIPQKT